ncbi:MAG: DUF2155 domain-containing protein, partial [Proteobacteria bacterium]|nr:DUF2155 domain-containing protein [Pseudomonadota bacterium]
PAAAGSASSAPAAPSDQPTPLSDAWLPRQAAEIQALDKVNGRSTVLTVPVGKSASYGSLTITVQACVVRPPDQPQDSAAYLVIADSHPDEPGFTGWMVQDSPALAMLQHPIYDIRVVGCRS